MENENDRASSRMMPRRPTRYRLVKKVGTVNLIEINGRMAPTEANDELAKRIDAMIAEGESNFLLDLSGVTYVTSTGVGTLLQCYQRAEKASGALKLLHLSQSVKQILTVSRLDMVFEIFDDEETALRSFDAASPPTEKKVRVRRTKKSDEDDE